MCGYLNTCTCPRVCVCTYVPGVAGAVVGTSCEVTCVIFFFFFLVVGYGVRLNALVERAGAFCVLLSLSHLCLVSVQRLITRADKRVWGCRRCRRRLPRHPPLRGLQLF